MLLAEDSKNKKYVLFSPVVFGIIQLSSVSRASVLLLLVFSHLIMTETESFLNILRGKVQRNWHSAFKRIRECLNLAPVPFPIRKKSPLTILGRTVDILLPLKYA